MTTAKELLAMIEAVKPDDEEALNEIDFKFDAYQKEITPLGNYKAWRKRRELTYSAFREPATSTSEVFYVSAPRYSRHRNALKTIRPEGWQLSIEQRLYGKWVAELTKVLKGSNPALRSPRLPNECLAELHAIIQAIKWERQNGK